MSTTNHKFGTTDWNEDTGPRKGGKFENGDNKTQYMKLVNGSNFVRIVTDPKRYITHKYKEKDDKGYGDWVKCSAPLHGSCPLCDRGDKPKKRWLVGCIDRASNQYRILDISSLIYDQIKTLNKSKWGDPKRYDVEIVMDDKAQAANFYKVLPQMPEALSTADLALVKTVNEDDLLRRCTPPEPAWVLSRINTIREKRGLTPLTSTPASSVKNEEPQKVEASTDVDEDLTFPAQH